MLSRRWPMEFAGCSHSGDDWERAACNGAWYGLRRSSRSLIVTDEMQILDYDDGDGN